jgi:putative nucleotidyltransferase with HDIG domain
VKRVATFAVPFEVLKKKSPSGPSSISLAEILSALSFALDLTEGAVPGHALRSCLIGMRLAQELDLPSERMADLYYALLLKDIGCSSNAARLCQIIGGGDERRVKAGAKLEDWTRPNRPKLSTLQLLWNNVQPEAGALRRTMGIVRIGMTQHRNNEEMIKLRCDRGAQILRKLGMGEATAEAVRGLDEHWDGSGYPDRRTGDAIPIEARILAVAQHLDAFASESGTERAIAVLEERSGRWFDPELVGIAKHLDKYGTMWRNALAATPEMDTRQAALELAPKSGDILKAADVDLICEAFADVVDAKGSFTFKHSVGVAEAAVGIARGLGLSQPRVQLVHRAALLHDIGKLRVPNSILDKPASLSAEEWSIMQEHPRLTWEILSRVKSFAELAFIAGAHHERLDGSGYPDKLVAEDLPIEARIIAVADGFSALAQSRPYRAGLPTDEVIEIMSRGVPRKLDADCFEALIASL